EAALMTLLPIWGVRRGLSESLAAMTLSAVYVGAMLMQVVVGMLSDRLSRLGMLRMCSVIGTAGAILIATSDAPLWLMFGMFCIGGGVASSISPIALSMAGDKSRGADLVTANAAIIAAYGLGGLSGPALGGVAMHLRNPQGLLWLCAAIYACL